MLKKRIIPVQLLLGGRLVKTVNFGTWRDVGDPVTSSRVYNDQTADELIFLNIDRDKRSIEALKAVIKRVSEVCFMPIAMGGGVTTAAEASEIILSGADKVVLNSVCYRSTEVIRSVSESFGAQSVTVCIDARYDAGQGRYVLYSDCGNRQETVTLAEHIGRMEEAGAGEIVIQSIDRDGTMSGFDIPLIQEAMRATTLPVIAAGGSGNYEQLYEAFTKTGVSALACGSLFNFSDSNPIRAKAFLTNYGLPFKVV
jgi:cyclase